jgi:hypothetical protein
MCMPFDGNNNDSTIVAYQQPSKLSTGVVAAQRVAEGCLERHWSRAEASRREKTKKTTDADD